MLFGPGASASSASGSASISWYLGDSNGPIETTLSNGLTVLDFSASPDELTMYCEIQVPSSYIAGTQIKLKNGKFFANPTTGNVLFRADSRLFKAAIDGTSTPTAYNSTNAQVAVAGSANQIVAIGDVDITSASGQINSVSVAAGNLILVTFYRKTSSETSALTDVARLIRASFEPSFT